jgi:hypothetical protein
VLGAGNITHLRRIADFAALYQVRTGSHGATDLSSVTMAAALHFDTWVLNFGTQEYMRQTEATDTVFPHEYAFWDGRLHIGDTLGHGVDIDEALAAEYPVQARLPARCAPRRRHSVQLVTQRQSLAVGWQQRAQLQTFATVHLADLRHPASRQRGPARGAAAQAAVLEDGWQTRLGVMMSAQAPPMNRPTVAFLRS